MYALIAMCLALALLVVLLHLKARLGRSMIVASIALAVLLGVTPSMFWQEIVHEWHNKPLGQTTGYLFVTLTALIVLVNALGIAMKEAGVSARLAEALHGLFRSRRLALAGMPIMMGMLPTPGGIMLSAPMVRDLGDHIGVSRARLAAINFWFRHQWETVWPLFPTVPLLQSMLGVSAFKLISHNAALWLVGTLGGVCCLLLSGIPPRDPNKQPNTRLLDNLRNFAHAFWPIVLAAAVYAALNLPPAVGLLVAVVIFLVLHKIRIGHWPAIFRSAFQGDFVLLVLGALLFKVNLEAGGAIADVVQFLTDINVPKHVLIFFLPMLVAFLTGVTMPTVAMTFPFLIPFIGTGDQAKMGLEVLAFSGLICGLLTTPVHLCLALSAGYFDVPLGRIILKVLGPIVFVAIAGVTMAMVLA